MDDNDRRLAEIEALCVRGEQLAGAVDEAIRLSTRLVDAGVVPDPEGDTAEAQIRRLASEMARIARAAGCRIATCTSSWQRRSTMTADERSDLEHLRADLRRVCDVSGRAPGFGWKDSRCWRALLDRGPRRHRDSDHARHSGPLRGVRSRPGAGGDIAKAARRPEAAHRAFMEEHEPARTTGARSPGSRTAVGANSRALRRIRMLSTCCQRSIG